MERHSVGKITAIDYLPQNTVTVELTNQITAEQSMRNLRWDEQVTTDSAFQFSVGDTGKITIELALLADEQDRSQYKYRIEDAAAGIDHEGTDLHLGPRLRPDNTRAAKTLLRAISNERARPMRPNWKGASTRRPWTCSRIASMSGPTYTRRTSRWRRLSVGELSSDESSTPSPRSLPPPFGIRHRPSRLGCMRLGNWTGNG